MKVNNDLFARSIQWLYSNEKVKDQKELASVTGITETTISRILNNRVKRPSEDTVRKLLKAFPDALNFEAEKNLPVLSMEKGKPYYNVDFTLGFDIMFNDQTQNPDYLIDFPPFNDCDCWCNAHGNSMFPTIASGDIVALKQIRDISYLINGEIYAIVTSNGLRTIKRIRDNGSTFTLIADNKEVGDQDIPKSLVTHAFHVRATFRIL